jgi:hypothetical protein
MTVPPMTFRFGEHEPICQRIENPLPDVYWQGDLIYSCSNESFESRSFAFAIPPA